MQKLSIKNKETSMDPRHWGSNWDHSDQLIGNTKNPNGKHVTFQCLLDC